MEDALKEMSDKNLRRHFALLLIHFMPSNPQALFDRFLEDMYQTPAAPTGTDPLSKEHRTGEVMRDIEYYLNIAGSTSRYIF